ncbi:cache domain-containing protein [Thiomicrorhabdus cannonii]|uniref:cache domain-containing protein n=1 Tax=Thiomicrorhabdus cannonii TaxID=2748011 RepID=UPI0015B908F4|nr:cache domain-containing protein [Thiomicrorhabdus cannonii]
MFNQHPSSSALHEYIQYLPEVKKYLAELQHQDLWWTTVAMVGKINNENMDSQLLDSIVDTQKEFQSLRDRMIEELVGRYLNQASSEVILKAQAVIDILIRNLFERTADVGFLATDDDLVEFMAKSQVSDAEREFIYRRIVEYVAKYSVYDDVLLVAPDGEVKAKLDLNNPVTHSHDPLIREALATEEDYLEVYRHSDLFPNKPTSLIYAKKIQAQLHGQLRTVGVLCLSFNFEDELQRLFRTLNADNDGYAIMLLDDHGRTLASNDLQHHAIGKQQVKPQGFKRPERQGANMHFATKTNGYQGFYGLPWFGYVTVPNQIAFSDKSSLKEMHVTIPKDSPLYLGALEEMNLKVSTLLLIVILNGKIISLKRDVKAFLPVLDNFQTISIDIQAIFARFIHHIHNVLVKTIQGKVAFSATLAVEVMDRNLYERANDCRWWALNSTFRQLLSQHHQGRELSAAQTQKLCDILSYINKLYTVYTNILLYDSRGKILAVSSPAQSELIGTVIPSPKDASRCLGITDTQKYAVSEFDKTELYDGDYTYVYHAAVKDWENEQRNVGGIALVFDSAPEFDAMLRDTQPKYINAALNEATFSAFVDRNGKVIASTSPHFAKGALLNLPAEVLQAANGKNDTVYWEDNGQPYLVGYKVSEGYREYKNGDGYSNDVIALVFTGI